MLSLSGEEEEIEQFVTGKVGVWNGKTKWEGVDGGELILDWGEWGAEELGASWLGLLWPEGSSFHTTVSGVLLPLCMLPLHPLQRFMLEIQRPLSGGGLSRSSFWVVNDRLFCLHL